MWAVNAKEFINRFVCLEVPVTTIFPWNSRNIGHDVRVWQHQPSQYDNANSLAGPSILAWDVLVQNHDFACFQKLLNQYILRYCIMLFSSSHQHQPSQYDNTDSKYSARNLTKTTSSRGIGARRPFWMLSDNSKSIYLGFSLELSCSL